MEYDKMLHSHVRAGETIRWKLYSSINFDKFHNYSLCTDSSKLIAVLFLLAQTDTSSM